MQRDTCRDTNAVSSSRGEGANAQLRAPAGSIDELPSDALRVRVYAGVDPVTKRRHDLIEVVPPGSEGSTHR
jgi:hypothetical protein